MLISKGLRQLMDRLYGQILGRHLCAAATFFLCAGILAGRLVWIPHSSWTLAALCAILFVLMLTVRRLVRGMPRSWQSLRDTASDAPSVRKTSVVFLAGLAAFFFVYSLHSTSDELCLGKDFEPSAETCSIHATVSKTLGTGKDYRILLLNAGYNSSEPCSLPGCGRLILRNNTIPLGFGDRIAFRSRIRRPLNRNNPGEFDWVSYCRNDRILWLVSVWNQDAVMLVRKGPRWHPSSILYDTREAMRLFLENNSGKYLRPWASEESAKNVRTFLKGIILGDRSEIGYAVRSTFADSGLAHSLSASGMHVAIVALLTMITVRVLTRPTPTIFLWVPFGKISAFASIPAMAAYCILVGASLPAVRSIIMGAVVAAAILLERRWDSFNSLVLATFLILLLYPLSLFAVDFQLSFAAVAGILLVVPPTMRRMKDRWIPDRGDPARGSGKDLTSLLSRLLYGSAAVVMTSVAATLGVTPLIIQVFHSFPTYTVVANLVADSMITVALFFGLFGSVIGLMWPFMGSILLFPADLAGHLTIKWAALVSGLPWSTIKFHHMAAFEAVVLWASVLGIIWIIRSPGRGPMVAAVAGIGCMWLLTAFLWIYGPLDAELKVMFLNVGKADAAFIKPRGTGGLLIDGGLKNQYFDAGASIILPFLWWNGTRSLDGIIVSHPQMDHMGGILSVIPHARPRTIWWNPTQPSPAFMKKIIAQAWTEDSQVLPADRTRQPVRIGPAILRFINRRCPKGACATGHEINDAAVVCRVECGSVSFLFTGDLELAGEEELLAAGMPLQADVLKVGHHGSKTSTSWRFLEAVRPKVAVVSSEYRAARGDPSAEVLDRLQTAGAKVFWTGRDGAVSVETDGKALSISTGRECR